MITLESFPRHLHSVSPQEWQKLFGFLPALEFNENFGEGSRGSGERPGLVPVPFVVSSKLVTDILTTLYELELIIAFDWSGWKEGKQKFSRDPFTADDLDAVTICQMITAVIRSDRFHEGSLLHAFQNGKMTILLQALEERVSAMVPESF